MSLKTEEKLELIKHIKLGTNEVLYYPYNYGRDPLPVRPISSFELDQCFYKALEYAPEKVSHLVVNLKLGLIDKERTIKLTDDGYSKLIKFYDTVNYWIVYYALKDFQDDDFRKPNYNEVNVFPNGYYYIRNMNEIHEIAAFVMSASHQTEEIIKEIFTDEIGREVAYRIHFLKQPIAEIGKMTNLQKKYIIYAKNELPKIISGKNKKKSYSVSGEEMTMQEFITQFGVDIALAQ